jgi:hypothetical protein
MIGFVFISGYDTRYEADTLNLEIIYFNNFSGTDRRLHVWDLSKIGKLGKLEDGDSQPSRDSI